MNQQLTYVKITSKPRLFYLLEKQDRSNAYLVYSREKGCSIFRINDAQLKNHLRTILCEKNLLM